MEIKGDLRPFSGEGVARAPDEPGVYVLYEADKLIYIGRAEGGLSITTLRARLKSRYEARHGLAIEQATHYRCEVSGDPVARECELLREYEALYGQPPPCNPVSYSVGANRQHILIRRRPS